MINKCPQTPRNKKEYITDVGQILLKDLGKKKYYKPKEVKNASKKSKYFDLDSLDWHCWAIAVFSSHEDFDIYHKEIGEMCDYVSMKTEVLKGLSFSPLDDLPIISGEDLDASWLDFGEVFDGVIDGVGGFVSGIFEGL